MTNRDQDDQTTALDGAAQIAARFAADMQRGSAMRRLKWTALGVGTAVFVPSLFRQVPLAEAAWWSASLVALAALGTLLHRRIMDLTPEMWRSAGLTAEQRASLRRSVEYGRPTNDPVVREALAGSSALQPRLLRLLLMRFGGLGIWGAATAVLWWRSPFSSYAGMGTAAVGGMMVCLHLVMARRVRASARRSGIG